MHFYFVEFDVSDRIPGALKIAYYLNSCSAPMDHHCGSKSLAITKSENLI